MARKRKSIVEKHCLMPAHSKCSEKEKKDLFERYQISLMELPKIKIDDPSIVNLSLKAGDVVKIIRNSPTAGQSVFYRSVINV